MSGGGRFDFDDGGTYCGGWEDGKAHGHGVCTGPKGQGEYSGAWAFGFEASGVYTWPSGNSFKGQWMQGKRHGLGVETKGRWVYRGEWTQGFKGRYGVRQSTSSGAKYEGTWTTGLQDGYGVETYADGVSVNHENGPGQMEQMPRGSYQGQWLRGMRHGYGVRQSVPYGLASHYRPKALRASLTSLRSENEEDHVVKDRDRKIDESRGGFVLKAKSDESPSTRRRSIFDKQGRSSLRKSLLAGLKLRKQKSTGDIQDSPRRPTGSVRSTISNISHTSADSSTSGVTSASMHTDSNLSFISQDDITDVNVTETYLGEWKNDKRSGFGISERSDGLKYEGEWYNNKKYGYGVTTFKDGAREEGKYKNNVLISSGKKSKLFLIRSSKLRERVDNAVSAAQRAAQIAQQKGDIAISRMANARTKAEAADMAAGQSQKDSDLARLKAKEFAPEFHQPGTDILRKRLEHGDYDEFSHMKPMHHNHIPPSHQHRSQSYRERPRSRSPTPTMAETRPRQTPMSALVSSALDCAIASSASHIGQNLHKLEEERPRGSIPQQTNLRQDHYGDPYSRDPRSNHYPRDQDRSYNQERYDSRDRDRIPNDVRARRELDRERGAEQERERGRFSELLNSTTVTDHFDQYRTLRDDSGLGREIEPHEEPVSYKAPSPSRPTPLPPPPPPPTAMDRSPDSGLSDTDDIMRHKTRPLQRRKTLPSIMKGATPVAAAAPNNFGPKPIIDAVSNPDGSPPSEPEAYIIENGIRKRIRAEVYSQPSVTPITITTTPSGVSSTAPPPVSAGGGTLKPKTQLRNRYKVEAPSILSKGANRGSLPDVTVCKELGKTVMPREQVSVLSHRRREEVLRMQEEAERRKQQEIVVRLADIKDWCQQRQLLMLVIAVNVSLATMFFNLLSQ